MECSGHVATESLERAVSFLPFPMRAMVPASANNSFREAVCLPFLRGAQNADGGWGYSPGAPSSVEPTCWGLLALASLPGGSEALRVEHAERWLGQAQLPDGSWGNCPGQKEGTWCTALAGLALLTSSKASEAVARAARWLCKSTPGEASLRWRFQAWRGRKRSLVAQDLSLRGWSWTAGTASWVEPTSYALLFLAALPEQLQTPAMRRRCRMGEAMLLNRVCPGGGWNLGNPVVYGVPGEPAVGPTVWALLALRGQSGRPEVASSLRWLEEAHRRSEGPTYLAQAHWCLRVYGRSVPPLEPALWDCYQKNQFFGSLLAMSLAALALSPEPDWLRRKENKGAG